MKTPRFASGAFSALLILSGCDQHLERISITAPESGTVVTLTNGSSATLRDVKIRVRNDAGYEEPWRSVPDLSKGASFPVDLAKSVENAHRPNMPNGIISTVQITPQFRVWEFRDDISSNGAIRLIAVATPVTNFGH